MSNPYNNEIIFNGRTLMSLKEDTVTSDKVLAGETFHDRSGAHQTGSLITHDVYDGLDSASASDALSANQGRVLNENYNALNNKIIVQSTGNAHTWWSSTVNTSSSDNLCIVSRVGRIVIINFQCKLKGSLSNNDNCIFTLPKKYERLTLSRGSVNQVGKTSSDSGVAGYCGFDTWTENGTTIYGGYIGDISAFSNKLVCGQIIYILKNEPNGEL